MAQFGRAFFIALALLFWGAGFSGEEGRAWAEPPSETPVDSKEESLAEAEMPEAWRPLAERLEADGFARAWLESVFSRPELRYTPLYMGWKVRELLGQAGRGVSLAIGPEDGAFSPPDYRSLLGSMSAASCRNFLAKNRRLFDGAYKRYKVPPAFVLAVLLAETGVGGNLGERPAMEALAGLALCDTLDKARPALRDLKLSPVQEAELQSVVAEKSAWAYGELAALLRYAQKLGQNPAEIPGSIYGAIGLCQFMPSNIEAYGVDADGDGLANVFKLGDAVYSVARYLAEHGWRKAQTDKARLAVLRSYNHSDEYAALVYGTAMQIIAPLRLGGKSKDGSPLSVSSQAVKDHMPPQNSKIPPLKLGSYQDVK